MTKDEGNPNSSVTKEQMQRFCIIRISSFLRH
jgi:hypothetical protein